MTQSSLQQHIMRRRPLKEEWIAYERAKSLAEQHPHLKAATAPLIAQADKRMEGLLAIEERRRNAQTQPKDQAND